MRRGTIRAVRTKRLIERIDGHMARGNELMERVDGRLVGLDRRLAGLDGRLEGLDVELRLSRESRERMVEDFRSLAHEMQARFEHVVRGFDARIAKNNRSLDRVLAALDLQTNSLGGVLRAVNSQSLAIQEVLARLPLPEEG